MDAQVSPPPEASRIFLTGASGLLGSHIAEALMTLGHDVVALQRASSDSGVPGAMGCSVVHGDILDDSETLAARMAGCRWVVHSAALVYPGMAWPSVRAVNVDGTRNVLHAASIAGVEHAVHISSVAVYGQVDGPVDEQTPLDSPLRPPDLYARSKRLAEEVAADVHSSGRLPVTVVRPSVVYGERDRLFAPGLARLLRLPLVPVLGRGDNTVPVVYSGNVAAGVVAALKGVGAGQAFNLAQDHPLTQERLLRGLASGLGRTPRFVHVPSNLIRRTARLADAVGIGIPGAEGLAVSRLARLALEDNPYRSERARTILGWIPPYEHEPSLRRAGAWLSKRQKGTKERSWR